jgi:ABC-type amino acid transport substrate-binding protein
LTAAAVGAALAAGGAWPTLARPLDAVHGAGVLRVAVYHDYKPYSWNEDGKSRGIDVAIAEALAKSLGVSLDLFEVRADDSLDDDLRNGVWKGSVVGAAPGDVMMHIPYDKRIEEKNDRVVLVAPYHVEGLALAVDPAKASEALDFSLFLHDKVAVDVGTLADIILISVHEQKVLPNVVHERGVERAAEAFERREVSAFYGEASAVEAFAKKGARPFAILYPKTDVGLSQWSLGMAVRSDSRDLGAYIDEAMRKMEASGEVRTIFANYGVDWRQPDAAR